MLNFSGFSVRTGFRREIPMFVEFPLQIRPIVWDISFMKFSIKSLFVSMLFIAVLLACIRDESLQVTFAFVFVVFSALVCGVLAGISLAHFLNQLVAIAQGSSWGILASRFRWTLLDGLTLTWSLIAIVIANFIIEESVHRCGTIVRYCWILGVVGVILGYRRFARYQLQGTSI